MNTIFMAELRSLIKSVDEDFSTEDMHFRCISHIFNLGAQDLLVQLKLDSDADLTDYDEIDNEECKSELEIPIEEKNNATPFNKLRTLFLKLKYSENLRRKLECCCGTVGIEMLSPIIDVSTRWYSAFDRIVKGIKLEKSITCLNSKTRRDWVNISVQSALQSTYDKLMKHYSRNNWSIVLC